MNKRTLRSPVSVGYAQNLKWCAVHVYLLVAILLTTTQHVFAQSPDTLAIRAWSTYYGGNFDEFGLAVATDPSGNVYIAGSTGSYTNTTTIATPGAHKTTYGGIFLVKFNSAGVRQWGTFYGSFSAVESGSALATDAAGNVYLTGYTGGTSGIATITSHQPIKSGHYDAFLVKFNSAGVRQWGTYYGGSGADYGTAVATDAAGNVYLSGKTESPSSIATSGAYQTSFAGTVDAFLVKFNSAGVRQWGTYYGGDAREQGLSVATDPSGNVYLAGETNDSSGTIATGGSHQAVRGGGGDAFLTKFSSSGSRLWGTYYGGSADEGGASIAVDRSGNVCMTGSTTSGAGIATPGAHQATYSYEDAYLVKFNSAGVRQWGTYYGAGYQDRGNSVAVDTLGNIYLSGETVGPSTFVSTAGGPQDVFGGGLGDCFLAKFNSIGVRRWGTYYGGEYLDRSFGVAVDLSGAIYITGSTESTIGIATPGAHDITLGVPGSFHPDAFLVKYENIDTISGNRSICVGSTVVYSNTASGGIWSSSNPAVATINSLTGLATGISTGTSAISYSVAGFVLTSVVTVNVAPAAISGTTVLCAGATSTLSSMSSGGTWASSNVSVAPVGSTGILREVLQVHQLSPTNCLMVARRQQKLLLMHYHQL